jgi:ribonuclease-3
MTQTGLARLLGHDFKNQQLLIQALTHRSYGGYNNERLEFLGDSVLNLVIADQLYQKYPKLPEGDLSRLRASLVKEATLSEIAFALNIGESLQLGEGELKSAGWRRPSVLADALEAIIGAVYIDDGFDASYRLVSRLYADRLDSLDPKSVGKDAKSLLQEYLQAKKIDVPEYAVLATEGEAHCQTFRVECHVRKFNLRTQGEGTSRRAAEQLAAQSAYEQLVKQGTHDAAK